MPNNDKPPHIPSQLAKLAEQLKDIRRNFGSLPDLRTLPKNHPLNQLANYRLPDDHPLRKLRQELRLSDDHPFRKLQQELHRLQEGVAKPGKRATKRAEEFPGLDETLNKLAVLRRNNPGNPRYHKLTAAADWVVKYLKLPESKHRTIERRISQRFPDFFNKRYVCLPPSQRSDGAQYRWDPDSGDASLPAPDWLINLAGSQGKQQRSNGAWAQAALDRECQAVADAKSGTRNSALNTAAFNLFQIVASGLLNEQEVRKRLFEAAEACGLVADDGAQAAWNTIESGARGGRAQPRSGPRQQPQQPAPSPAPAATPCSIKETLDVFNRWLILPDLTPVYAMLGTIAANLLPGDPIWLGIIGPPSSAKTEILNSALALPYVQRAATLTPAGLLSGTPRKQRAAGASGGLLHKIGSFGILVPKDFGSILSMRPDAKAEILAAMRELYDGEWTRQLGTDGGRTLSWKGKLGLLFAATNVLDAHHSVIGSMGDRFLLSRLHPDDENQFGWGPATCWSDDSGDAEAVMVGISGGDNLSILQANCAKWVQL